jgi:hypothetical protein
MVPVPSQEPQWCIDRYEGRVVDGVVETVAGQIPTEQISYDEAQAACQATTVLDADGGAVAFKHLVTATEWEDAADNVLGSGGTMFPYGDTWDDDACATALASGAAGYTEAQPAGAFSRCVSSFGVYDQLGNLWEWMDPEISVDAAKAEARFAEAGIALTIGDDGTLGAAGDLSTLHVELIGVLPGDVSDLDGRLFVTAEQISVEASNGFLMLRDDPPQDGWYPIRLELTDDGAWVNADLDEDGTPIPDKRGCAYYWGYDALCDVHKTNYLHPHDFSGTVGFRCAAPPL